MQSGPVCAKLWLQARSGDVHVRQQRRAGTQASRRRWRQRRLRQWCCWGSWRRSIRGCTSVQTVLLEHSSGCGSLVYIWLLDHPIHTRTVQPLAETPLSLAQSLEIFTGSVICTGSTQTGQSEGFGGLEWWVMREAASVATPVLLGSGCGEELEEDCFLGDRARND